MYPASSSEHDQFAAIYAALRERFEVEQGDPERELVADLSGRSIADVARAVRAITGPADGEVVVLWPGDGRSARMAAAELAGGLADLWRPGSDDLLVADPSRRWAVLLDHEARLWLFGERSR